jgi:hypothetical protein
MLRELTESEYTYVSGGIEDTRDSSGGSAGADHGGLVDHGSVYGSDGSSYDRSVYGDGTTIEKSASAGSGTTYGRETYSNGAYVDFTIDAAGHIDITGSGGGGGGGEGGGGGGPGG